METLETIGMINGIIAGIISYIIIVGNLHYFTKSWRLAFLYTTLIAIGIGIVAHIIATTTFQ